MQYNYSIIDICFFCLLTQIASEQSITFAVLDKMRAALPKLEMHVSGYALLPYGKHPLIIERSCAYIRLAADYDQFDILEIVGKVYFPNKRLTNNVFVFYGKFIENGQPTIGSVLIFHRATYGHVIVAVLPIGRNTVYKSLDTLG